MENTKTKWILGIVGTVVLGALGSGLWSIAFAPALGGTGRFLLSLFTLGIDALRDNAYKNAAKGFQEQASFLTVFILMGIFSGVLTSTITTVFGRKPDPTLPEGPATQVTVDRLQARLKKLNRTLRVFWLITVFLFSIVIVDVAVKSYSTRAVTFFHQSLAICRPFISDQEQFKLVARFALVESRRDYLALVNDLGTIANTNLTKLPAFDPW